MIHYLKYNGFRSLKRGYVAGVFLAVFSIFFFSSQIFAQYGDQKPDLKFQRIQEGLISNEITFIHQDRLDFIWIGTNSGVQRFDGINFRTYTRSDASGLNESIIRSVYEDENDNLWVGTSNYLHKYNRETDNFTAYELPNIYQEDPFETSLPNTILEDNNGTMWVAAGTDGLYSFDKQNEQFVPYENLNIRNINSIAGPVDDILWLATEGNGLVKLHLDTGNTEIFINDPADSSSISSNFITHMVIDHQGTLWAGTRRNGLNKMAVENGRVTFTHYKHEPGNPHSLGNNNIYILFVDRDGNLWTGNDNGGLHLYNRENNMFYHYGSEANNPNSLSHHSVSYIYQDRAGRIWIGTGLSGINIYDEFADNFEHFSTARTMGRLNSNIIRDFWEDVNGNIWIATDGGGLNYFVRDQRTFTAFTHDPDDPNSINSNAVLTIAEDPDGNLWTGTWDGGVNILTDSREGTFISFKEKFGITDYPINNVFDIHFDRQFDYVWIAAFGEGLYRFNSDNGQIELYNFVPDNSTGLSSNNVFRIFEDSKNNIWIGSFNGLSVLTPENKETGIFKNYTKDETDSTSLSGNGVRHILEDQNQNIWIATIEGISKYIEETENFVNYYTSDGLPSNETRSIAEDDNGHFWIGTMMGLSHFDPFNNSFKNYNKTDGLQGDEFSRYSARKLSTGEMIFGGNNGFNLFHPERIKANPFPPSVYISDFKLFNEPVDFTQPDSPINKHISAIDTLVLSHNQNVFTLEYIAISFTKAEQQQYAFKMEGFEQDWNYVGTQRNATYTNLNPGNYTFRVKASNNDGIWNEDGVSLALIITPPFWQTTWFYLLTVLFFGGLIFTGYRLRVRSIREHNKQLEKQVADRTDELEVKNSDLETTLLELEATKDELVEKAHKAGMADVATGVLHNVGNILNSVNTSTALIKDTIKKSKIDGFVKANAILREHIDQLDRFIAENPKGRELMHYYLKLEKPLREERDEIVIQSERLEDKISLINEVIAAQQTYAGISVHASQTSLDEMIDNALALQAGSIERHGLKVEKNLQATSPIIAQRSKLIHVLVNLFKNAKEAMAGNTPAEKKLFIKTWQDEIFVYLSITDNGPGIKPEHLNKIFTQGFTTKQNGHGFGLHSCANYMTEMGGKIEVENQRVDNGSTFTLSFPIATNSPAGMAKKNFTEPTEESEGT